MTPPVTQPKNLGPEEAIKPKRLLLVGIGDEATLSLDKMERVGKVALREAVKLGYVEAISDAGGVVTNSTCGACFGYHMGVVGAGEVCLTASTRNFRGRMGSPDADIYMASPATVAASALAGHIVDPRKVTV